MEVRDQEIKEDVSYDNNFNCSPSSSPPTPPSPLPVSVGPGLHNYSFTPSPSPSPPFSPPSSGRTSAENLPLLLETLSTPAAYRLPPSAFSLDGKDVGQDDKRNCDTSDSSCIEELIHWIALRCCSCLSWTTKMSEQLVSRIHSD